MGRCPFFFLHFSSVMFQYDNNLKHPFYGLSEKVVNFAKDGLEGKRGVDGRYGGWDCQLLNCFTK